MSEGFVDLRLNAHATDSAEDFWPSFTDIMTVIVMIFLLAAVVMLLRNHELVSQLRRTMEAERTASELARLTAEQKEQVAMKLGTTESELATLRMQLLLAREQRARAETEGKRLGEELAKITTERDALATQAETLRRTEADLQARISQLQTENAATEAARKLTDAELERVRGERDKLVARSRQQSEELRNISSRAESAERQLTDSRGEYSVLKRKYDRLVKPARTTVGKHVVEVRYSRTDGKLAIDMKDADDPAPSRVTPGALHEKLKALKAANPGKLYVKIIIPEDSGLTYDEAWRFTNDVLGKYDYYYQD